MQSDQSDQEITPATSTEVPQSIESISAKSQPLINLSDSDSDLDNDDGNNSYLAGLNVPDRLKNILRYKDINNTQVGNGDNSDSDDDDDLFMKPLAPKTPSTPSGSAATPTITASTTTRLPPIERLEPNTDQQNRFQQLLARAMASDSSSDDDNTTIKGKKKKKATKTKTKTTKKPPTTKKTTAAKPRKPQKKKGTTTATAKKKKTKTTKDDDSANDDQGVINDSDSDALSSSSSGSFGGITNKKKKKSMTPAILQNTDDSDSDEATTKPRKQLSRKAKLEMQRETERLRRDAHVKIQPRVIRKTLDSFLEKLDAGEKDDTPSRSPVFLDDDNDDREDLQQNSKAKQSPSRVNIYTKYKKELQKLEEFNKNNLDDDEDDGLIIVRTESRGTKFMKTLLSAVSPEQSSRVQNTDITNRIKGKSPSSPLALRTLNQHLMAKMTQEQQTHRQKMEEKAKAMGVYLSAEERATKHLEREQEAAVLDLEIQQLLYKKSVQKQATGSTNNRVDDEEEDDDYIEGNDDGLVFSGDDEEEDDDEENDNPAYDDLDDDDEGPVVLSRRTKSTMKQKNPFLEDDDDERGINKKGPKAPEPAHSIANFFTGKSNKTNTDDDVDDMTLTNEPKKLSRLMQRTTIETNEDEEMDLQEHDDSNHPSEVDNNDEHEEMDEIATNQQTSTIKSTIPMPKKPKERNDYVEEEAEEEEDEFFGLGGPDIAESADLDQFEDDGMLVQDSNNNEKVNSSELQAEYHKNMIESDQHMVERLIKDITGGGLRRKRAAAAAGLLLDDYDLYDDDDRDDLVALRLASANKRKKFMEGDDMMNFLASDPKTAAFAKAAMPMPNELDLSGDEMEKSDGEGGDGNKEADKKDNSNNANNNAHSDDDDDEVNSQLDIYNGADTVDGSNDLHNGDDTGADTMADGANDLHYDSDESDEMKVNIDMMVGDFVQPWARHSSIVDASRAQD